MRDMKIFQRHDCAGIGREPGDGIILHRHRENTKSITLQQKFRRDHGRVDWKLGILPDSADRLPACLLEKFEKQVACRPGQARRGTSPSDWRTGSLSSKVLAFSCNVKLRS